MRAEPAIRPFVLASASPRRRELLAGTPFTVVPAHIDETQQPGEAPLAYVCRMAREKAQAVAGGRVLAADTIVWLGEEVLHKPVDAADAARILRRLSGRSHTVTTAVALRDGDLLQERAEHTRVTFRPLRAAEIDAYVATGEPLDKAGAYGIQGLGGALVRSVRGSYTNVVGLPLHEALALLRR